MILKRFLYYSYKRIYLIKRWAQQRFTAAGFFVLFCIGASALVGIDTKQTLAYQIFAFLLCLLLISMISSLFFRIRFTANRVLPRFGTVGEKIEYQIEVRNKSGKIQKNLKILNNFEDDCPLLKEFMEAVEPGEEKRNYFDKIFGYYRWLWLVSRKKRVETKAGYLLSVPARGKIDVTLKMIPRQRGILKMTGVTIACPDPIGLFNGSVTLPIKDSILILPKRYMIPQIELSGSRKYHAGGVVLASSVGDSEEFTSLRDYRPGDPFRKIHWKSWAKTGQPVVKEYQDEFFVRHALILDTFHRMDYSDIFEEAVSIASSFAFSIQTQDSLLDLMFVGTEAYCFTSGRGLSNIDQILKIMASVIPCKDKPFSHLTSVVINRAHLLSGCICVLLSWDQERKKIIQLLKGLGVPVLVVVLSEKGQPAEQHNPGPMKYDPENFHPVTLGKISEGLAKL